ncbi:MAG TPA: class I SAM-dependent methyltransferase [Pyrinomonadaceae bacterium]|nr:class I SAM-dependent methyltransferase [Pyrinomonadaceae bacterium]
MSAPTHQTREEFDRIALLTEQHGGGAGDVYHRYLMRRLPPHLENVLEVGCGTGAFTRLLASRARRVTALDLSPQMIRLAESQSAGCNNIGYLLGDVMRLPLPAECFDAVVSIATLHHLPLAQAVRKMKDALRPNGVLVIHDLIADAGVFDAGVSALACPVSVLRRFWKTGRVRMSREVREAWAEHGKHEVYLTSAEVRRMCRKYLPAARVKRHLLWRYTVVWRKPA